MSPLTRRSLLAATSGLVALALGRTLHAGEPGAAEIALRAQAYYDRADTLRADFTQVVHLVADGQRRVSRGTLLLAKPGRMSFRFAPPRGGRVVSDGKTLRVYDAEHATLYRSKLSLSPYPAALALLMGSGLLTRDFDLEKLDPGDAGGWVLAARPHESTPAYQRLLLWLDASTAALRRVLVVDAQGNTNRFDLSAVELGVLVTAKDFQLHVPPGTTVVRAS